MKANTVSVLVSDQEKAHRFYTDILGFAPKHDIPMGEFRWLTVVSPDDPDGAHVALEPNANPMLNGESEAYQRALYEHGIPATAFEVDDIEQEVQRLKSLGVRFTQEPTDQGPVTAAVLDDTCGNLILIFQTQAPS